MVYPLPYCPLANWSQFCPSSAFCSSVLPLESRFSLQLLVVHFTPCPTLAISFPKVSTADWTWYLN